jgi:hypothetical protein
MSHITINFLKKAENIEEAIRHINNCLDTENSFFDGYEVIESDCGTLENKKHILDEILREHDYLVKAEKFIKEAEKQRQKLCFTSAGAFYHRAGLLYSQNISDDMPYYNITDWSYDVPPDAKDWYFIPVDFHC